MYEARIAITKVHYFLGLFTDDVSAAIVYDAWAVRLGVSCRSNGAAEHYAGELPQRDVGEKQPCGICNGANIITAFKRTDGDWVAYGTIPCPSCQNQNENQNL